MTRKKKEKERERERKRKGKKKIRAEQRQKGGSEDRGRQRRVLGLIAKIAQMPRPWRMSRWLITVPLAPEIWPS